MEAWQKDHISKILPELIQNTICGFVFLSKLTAFLSSEERHILTAKNTRGDTIEAADMLYKIAVTRHNAYEILTKALLETKQLGAFRALTKEWILVTYRHTLDRCQIMQEDEVIQNALKGLDWMGQEVEGSLTQNSNQIRRVKKSSSRIMTTFLFFSLLIVTISIIASMHLKLMGVEEELEIAKLNLKKLQDEYFNLIHLEKHNDLSKDLHMVYSKELQSLIQQQTEFLPIFSESPFGFHHSASDTAISKMKQKYGSESLFSTVTASKFLQEKYEEEIGSQATISIDIGSKYCKSLVQYKGNIYKIPHYDPSGKIYYNGMSTYVGVDGLQGCIGQCAINALTYWSRTEPRPVFYGIKDILARWSGFDSLSEEEMILGFSVRDGSYSDGEPRLSTHKNSYPISYLVAKLSEKLLQNAESFFGAAIKNCAFTIPNDFHEMQRKVILQAAFSVGCLHTLLLEEDIAVAMSSRHLVNYLSFERKLLIIQLGAYFWRFSVVHEVERGQFYKILSTKRSRGGFVLHRNMMFYCMRKFIAAENISAFEVNRLIYFNEPRRLFESCDTAIVYLTTVPATTIYIPDFKDGLHLNVSITRDQFQKLNNNVFEDIGKLIASTMMEANLATGQIDEVIVTGGQSRIPKVQEIIRDYFSWVSWQVSLKFKTVVEPEDMAVFGAALKRVVSSEK